MSHHGTAPSGEAGGVVTPTNMEDLGFRDYEVARSSGKEELCHVVVYVKDVKPGFPHEILSPDPFVILQLEGTLFLSITSRLHELFVACPLQTFSMSGGGFFSSLVSPVPERRHNTTDATRTRYQGDDHDNADMTSSSGPPPGCKEGSLHVLVRNAENLQNVERFGFSDPHVILELEGRDVQRHF
eukprot:sb/3471416/